MLGFIQGLLLIIIEVSIYFFYAQTFCEAGDKITVRRTIATVVTEYYGAVTPQIRQAGNRLSGLPETNYCANLLA